MHRFRNQYGLFEKNLARLSLQSWLCRILTATLLSAFFLSGASFAQRRTIQGAESVSSAVPIVINQTLQDLPPASIWRTGDPIRQANPRRITNPDALTRPVPPFVPQRDPLLDIQLRAPIRVFTPPDLNLAGQGFSGVFPPDTVGEIGTTHYLQIINNGAGTSLTVYDKTTGALVSGPLRLGDLAPIGNICNTSPGGDPIALYDHLADRWLLTEFTLFPLLNLCVYVSSAADPVTSTWVLYQFSTPDFPDYPKYAVWPDAYYVGTNESLPAVYALERTQMLAGMSASLQRFTAPRLAAFGFNILQPADLDGATPPPAGTPGLFMRHRDDEVHGPPTIAGPDFVEIWEFHVDFANPGNSIFTGPIDIVVTDFSSELCGTVSFSCVPQPSPATFSNNLDPLREPIMWRLQYRNFGTHQTLVGAFVQDVSGFDHHGIRWFELRRTGIGAWSLFQEGTYAPDPDHRFMPSIAMDQGGNIALAYSVSSTTTFPSSRYTGRLAGDPAGVMPQAETTMIPGSNSQTIGTRWGDYSSMNVDPSDGCQFWYTNAYVGADGLWATQIAKFSFPECSGSGQTQCLVPASGDWVVSEDCTLSQNASAPANVVVNPNVTLTIAPGIVLDIDSSSYNLRVKTGARVVIKPGGKVGQ